MKIENKYTLYIVATAKNNIAITGHIYPIEGKKY